MNYYYSNYSQYPPSQVQKYKKTQDPRLIALKQDNLQLQKSLKQLNECYQQKTNLLQSELQKSKQRQSTLLQWKRVYIDKNLFENEKYQKELQRMIQIMQQMSVSFMEQKQNYQKVIEVKDNQIEELKKQNLLLKESKERNEENIQSLAKKYIGEIERLNQELKQLKEEVEYDEEIAGNEEDLERYDFDGQEVEVQEDALKDISNCNPLQNIQEAKEFGVKSSQPYQAVEQTQQLIFF